MKTIWFMDLSQDQREVFKRQLSSSKDVLEKLKEIIENKRKETILSEDYESPSWAYKQADRNGYNRALTEILNILNI